RHTRFSRDWSSDVCSSDLYRRNGDEIRPLKSEQPGRFRKFRVIADQHADFPKGRGKDRIGPRPRGEDLLLPPPQKGFAADSDHRSEERRVGKAEESLAAAR